MYQIKVVARDGLQNSATVTRTVQVEGRLKLGNFTQAVTDLQLNTTGIPLTVGRVYDTLRADQLGDLGYGWNLNFGIPRFEGVYYTDHLNGAGEQDYRSFVDGTRIVITLPDGTTAGFTFQPVLNIRNGYGFPFGVTEYLPYFVPDRGVQSQCSAPRKLIHIL